jgi:hypothetical protein
MGTAALGRSHLIFASKSRFGKNLVKPPERPISP